MNDTEDYRPTLPPSMPLPQQIDHLVGIVTRLRRELAELKKPTPQQAAADIAEERRDAATARKRDREEAQQAAAAADLQRARAAAIRALVKLLPEAIAQAKAKPPRPALLRLILRATR